MEMSASFIQLVFWRFTTLVIVKWSCLLVIYKEIACNIYKRSWNFSEALIITTFPDAVCVCETYHLSVLQLLPCWRLLAGRWFGFLCLSLHSGNTVIARTGFRSSDARGSLSKWCPSFSGTGFPYKILLHYKGKFALLHFYFNGCGNKLDTDIQLYPPTNIIFSICFLYTLSTFLADVWKLYVKQRRIPQTPSKPDV